MKKKYKSRTRGVFSRIINIRFWFDWERMKAFTLFIVDGFGRLFTIEKSNKNDSFKQAQKQFKLTEDDLLLKQTALYRLSMLMLALAALILLYAIYHIFYGSLKATLVSLVVMIIALVLAFRYHFWSFQIAQRKLGCSFIEWYKATVLGINNE